MRCPNTRWGWRKLPSTALLPAPPPWAAHDSHAKQFAWRSQQTFMLEHVWGKDTTGGLWPWMTHNGTLLRDWGSWATYPGKGKLRNMAENLNLPGLERVALLQPPMQPCLTGGILVHWDLKKAKVRVLQRRKEKDRNLSRVLCSDFCLFPFFPSLWTSDYIFVLVGSKLSQLKFSDLMQL